MAVESQYMPNPYHNFSHGVDVLHASARMLKVCHSETFLTETEQFAVLISAICHDLGHPGLNNPFLVETCHELAIRYNDKSPLENMHCARLFDLVSLGDAACATNVLGNFEKERYREFRKVAIETILHTDIF